MEMQLQELINKIRSEGVEQADRDAQKIIENAKKEAYSIVEQARSEAQSLIDNAKKETKRISEAGNQALSQAGRDLLITTRLKITALFDLLIKTEVKESLSTNTMGAIIETIVQNWQPQKHQDLEILLNPRDLETLKNGYTYKLQKKFRDGILFKPVDSIDSGFFIGEKDSHMVYDFSDEGIAEILSSYLNPHLSAILKEK